MPNLIVCPNCRSNVHVPDSSSSFISCPNCRASIHVASATLSAMGTGTPMRNRPRSRLPRLLFRLGATACVFLVVFFWMLFNRPQAPRLDGGGEVPGGGAAQREEPGQPATEEDRELAQKLNRLARAMHRYHDRHFQFPVAASADGSVHDKNGIPFLSWRVHLLPFLDQQALYDRFHLDEPWDSPHNKPLLEQMPDVFRAPQGVNSTTRFHLLSGGGAVFDGGKKVGIRDLRDGASRTILVVLSGIDRAAPWTKPENLKFDASRPLAALGDLGGQPIRAVMADAEVITLPADIDPQSFRALATSSGGEIVPDDILR